MKLKLVRDIYNPTFEQIHFSAPCSLCVNFKHDKDTDLKMCHKEDKPICISGLVDELLYTYITTHEGNPVGCSQFNYVKSKRVKIL